MYIYTFTHVRICVYTDTCVNMCITYLHSCQHGRIHKQTDMQTSTRTHPHNDIPTYMHTCIYAYMHTVTHTHIHTHTHTQRHGFAHTNTHTHTQKHTMELCRVFYAHTCGHEPGIFGHDPSGGFSQRPLGRCEFFSLLGSLMSMSHFVCRKMLWLELCQKGVKRHRRRPSVPLQRSALSL